MQVHAVLQLTTCRHACAAASELQIYFEAQSKLACRRISRHSSWDWFLLETYSEAQAKILENLGSWDWFPLVTVL